MFNWAAFCLILAVGVYLELELLDLGLEICNVFGGEFWWFFDCWGFDFSVVFLHVVFNFAGSLCIFDRVECFLICLVKLWDTCEHDCSGISSKWVLQQSRQLAVSIPDKTLLEFLRFFTQWVNTVPQRQQTLINISTLNHPLPSVFRRMGPFTARQVNYL